MDKSSIIIEISSFIVEIGLCPECIEKEIPLHWENSDEQSEANSWENESFVVGENKSES